MTRFRWADSIREFTRSCGLTTREILEGQTFSQFFAVWVRAPLTSDGLDMGALKKQINAKRAEKGLPPMKPANGKG